MTTQTEQEAPTEKISAVAKVIREFWDEEIETKPESEQNETELASRILVYLHTHETPEWEVQWRMVGQSVWGHSRKHGSRSAAEEHWATARASKGSAWEVRLVWRTPAGPWMEVQP